MAAQLPDMMTAVEITSPGGPDVLKPTKRPVPKPGAGEVLVQVAAAGINRPDVFQRMGNYNPPPGTTDIPGLEVAGKVVALGDGAQGWSVGDELCALVAGGGYAEYCAAPAAQCLPMPKGLSVIEAGGVPETFFTVWTNVFERGRLQSGESFLVHGGSSGIGVTAIQLAKAFGARVFATAGSSEKCRACEELGADRAINYKTGDFVAVIKEATQGKGVDVILDMVGGDYLPRNMEALAVDGRTVSIATLGGTKATINVNQMMVRRLTLTGSTLRPRSVEQKGAIAGQLRSKVWPLFEQGRIKVPVHATFPLAEAAQAHALMESSTHIGKIVLAVRD